MSDTAYSATARTRAGGVESPVMANSRARIERRLESARNYQEFTASAMGANIEDVPSRQAETAELALNMLGTKRDASLAKESAMKNLQNIIAGVKNTDALDDMFNNGELPRTVKKSEYDKTKRYLKSLMNAGYSYDEVVTRSVYWSELNRVNNAWAY